jgi:hypothetical protein
MGLIGIGCLTFMSVLHELFQLVGGPPWPAWLSEIFFHFFMALLSLLYGLGLLRLRINSEHEQQILEAQAIS